MKANPQIEITMNCMQSGYEKNRQQILQWLLTMVPIITDEQEPATEIIYLKTINHIASFCLT